MLTARPSLPPFDNDSNAAPNCGQQLGRPTGASASVEEAISAISPSPKVDRLGDVLTGAAHLAALILLAPSTMSAGMRPRVRRPLWARSWLRRTGAPTLTARISAAASTAADP